MTIATLQERITREGEGDAGMRMLLVIAALTAIAAWPSSAAAATCADYPNQAAAQRAADTRDGNGDGVYCVSLPCPCSTAGGGQSKPKPRSKRKPTRPVVGAPKALGPRTKSRGCHVRGPLPDSACTPGSVFSRATPRVFCHSGYTAKVRHVTSATKRGIYSAYGISSHRSGQYEIDHLVPLELGGSNSVANLFPEAAAPTPGFRQKDSLENETSRRACSGRASYRTLQQRIAKNWVSLDNDLLG